MGIKIKYLLVFLFVLGNCCYTLAQKTRQTAKFHIGIETNIGTTFPNFVTEKEKWQPTVYAAWEARLSVLMRFSQHWSGDIGVGLSGYAMGNKTINDRYTLDFFSPSLLLGLQYSTSISKKSEGFLGLSIGGQQGYNDSFTEVFEDYTVVSSSTDLSYFFIRPQIGIRKEMETKRKKKFPISYEYGVYFRYNVNGLGKAEFTHTDNYIEILQPKGHVSGVFFKVLFPSSNTKIRLKTKEKELPPVIYNPRMS